MGAQLSEKEQLQQAAYLLRLQGLSPEEAEIQARSRVYGSVNTPNAYRLPPDNGKTAPLFMHDGPTAEQLQADLDKYRPKPPVKRGPLFEHDGPTKEQLDRDRERYKYENSNMTDTQGMLRSIGQFLGFVDTDKEADAKQLREGIKGWELAKKTLGVEKTLGGKKPPAKKFPKQAPKNLEEGVKAAFDANTPDDDEAMKLLKAKIDQFEKGKKGLDWSPVIALVDSWTGSNLLQAYDKPMSDEEREKMVMTLRGKLAEQEGELAYKREYMAEQRKQAKDRMDAQAAQKDADRDLRLQIANIGAAAGAARSEAAEERQHLSRKSKYLKENKNALDAIARARYGVKDEKDKSYQLHIGSVNEDIYDTGRELEQMGAAPKGQGYSMALEFYLAKPSGPDGADR